MKPTIELVFDERGVLRDAYALHTDAASTRAARLTLSGAEEQMKVDGPSDTTLKIPSAFVKRTYI